MTAVVLTTTDPRWNDVRTVQAIAAGPEWPAKVRAYWETVSRVAHDQAHNRPVFGCPGCPQVEGCPSCGESAATCEDPAGHRRIWVAGDASLLIPVGGDR